MDDLLQRQVIKNEEEIEKLEHSTEEEFQKIRDTISSLESRAWEEMSKIKKEVRELDITQKLQGKDIANIQQTLGVIADNTTWIKRTTIGGLITASIGGFISLIVWLAQH